MNPWSFFKDGQEPQPKLLSGIWNFTDTHRSQNVTQAAHKLIIYGVCVGVQLVSSYLSSTLIAIARGNLQLELRNLARRRDGPPYGCTGTIQQATVRLLSEHCGQQASVSGAAVGMVAVSHTSHSTSFITVMNYVYCWASTTSSRLFPQQQIVTSSLEMYFYLILINYLTML